MNTETKVHEYHLRTSNRACGQTTQEIYIKGYNDGKSGGYNDGKSDAIKEFAERLKQDVIDMHDWPGNTDRMLKIIDKRMKETLGDE